MVKSNKQTDKHLSNFNISILLNNYCLEFCDASNGSDDAPSSSLSVDVKFVSSDEIF